MEDLVSGKTIQEGLASHPLTMLAWAFHGSSDGILITDPKGMILMVNDAFCRMFGYGRDEVIGKRTGFLKSGYSTPEFYRQMWNSLSEKGEWKGEIVNRTRDGDDKVCFLTITPIIADDGTRLGYLGVEIDLTERKRLEAQVLHAEQLAAIGEAMATLAHEIRNPLNGLRMNIFMLKQARANNEPWSTDDEESLQLLEREAGRLHELVTSVLGFARRTELRYEQVEVAELTHDIDTLTQAQAEAHSVQIAHRIENPSFLVRCDPDLIKQVLLNLVQNAIEEAAHSQERQVLIEATEENTNDYGLSVSGRVLSISVYNSGSVIPKTVQQRLFKPFFTTKSTGLGLGLANSLKIARQHHGTILLDSPVSRPPYATKFQLLLPI